MSIQKQQRMLSYKPTIIVATPGRLWELMSDYSEAYLLEKLPLIDVFALDEADRMIADGHFKEMREIIAYIYSERVNAKKAKFKKTLKKKDEEEEKEDVDVTQFKEAAFEDDNFFIGKNLEGGDNGDIDLSKVQDIYDDDAIMEEFKD